MKKGTSRLKHYFVDESGSPEIFNRKGSINIGELGCSRYFMLGFLDVDDPRQFREDVRKLHHQVLNDPYYINIPSLQPESRKTALGFHAKDDIPEIRQQVFQLLKSKKGLRFVAVVKDKYKVADYAIERKTRDQHYKYKPNELYDLLTRRIFKNYLHLSEEYRIYYAVRGEKPRTEAFGNCLKLAQQRFMQEHNLQDASKVTIFPSFPTKEPCLQATDYFLWALQRLYEKGENRYFEYLRDQFDLIIDIDDTTVRKYGEYYDNKRNPINFDRINAAHRIK